MMSNSWPHFQPGPSGALSSELASLGGGAHPQLSLPLPLRDQTALLSLHCVWVQQVDDYDINVDPINFDECDGNSLCNGFHSQVNCVAAATT